MLLPVPTVQLYFFGLAARTDELQLHSNGMVIICAIIRNGVGDPVLSLVSPACDEVAIQSCLESVSASAVPLEPSRFRQVQDPVLSLIFKSLRTLGRMCSLGGGRPHTLSRA